MKKMTVFLLLTAILLSLMGCLEQKEPITTPVSFYYPRSEFTYGSTDSVTTAEVRDAALFSNDHFAILSAYLAGPKKEDLKSPFPTGTTLTQLSVANGTASIILSDHIAVLSGIDLTVACVCLTRTIMELTGAKRVEISAETKLLGGSKSITMDSSNVYLSESSAK